MKIFFLFLFSYYYYYIDCIRVPLDWNEAAASSLKHQDILNFNGNKKQINSAPSNWNSDKIVLLNGFVPSNYRPSSYRHNNNVNYPYAKGTKIKELTIKPPSFGYSNDQKYSKKPIGQYGKKPESSHTILRIKPVGSGYYEKNNQGHNKPTKRPVQRGHQKLIVPALPASAANGNLKSLSPSSSSPNYITNGYANVRVQGRPSTINQQKIETSQKTKKSPPNQRQSARAPPPKPINQYDFINGPGKAEYRNSLNKNHRDNTYHEPVEQDDVEWHKNEEERRNEPQSKEPSPAYSDVETRPIYPGPGLWAKPGKKYKPHITPHNKFIDLDKDETRPDGYDVFEDLEKFFENQRSSIENKFDKDSGVPSYFDRIRQKPSESAVHSNIYDPFQASSIYTNPDYNIAEQKIREKQFDKFSTKSVQPETNPPLKKYDSNNNNNNKYKHHTNSRQEKQAKNRVAEENDSTGQKQTIFIPQRQYTQLRHSEDEKHLPHDPEEHGRLKEIIKDSKVHTIYSEEGYEDSAYDHAGHEKKAEHNDKEEGIDKSKYKKDKLKHSAKSKRDSEMAESKIIPVTSVIDNKQTADEESNNKKPEKEGQLNSKTKTKSNNKVQMRRKRSAPKWLETVEIDTDFIDKINHTFAPKNNDKEKIDIKKYPNYVRTKVNHDSPLVYAENSENVPIKKPGELSFYKTSDRFQCPDMPQDIYPVPDRIENARKNQEDDEGEEDDDDDDAEGGGDGEDIDAVTPKGPRLQLGDKIDCLKVRYFGQNPFDNPIFQEKTVGSVKPIFGELEKVAKTFMTTRPFKGNRVKLERRSEKPDQEKIFNNKSEKKQEEETKLKKNIEVIKIADNKTIINQFSADQPAVKVSLASNKIAVFKVNKSESMLDVESTTVPSVISLITTPKYTIHLTPQNIYDQIKLLDHLPEEGASTEGKKENTNNVVKEKQEQIIENKKESQAKREGRVPKMLNDKSESEQTVSSLTEATPLEPQPLRAGKPHRRPLYQIFDINSYLTTTPYGIIQHSTVLPKHQVKSEVFYKEEIKPSEQLNVFADIINNIKLNKNQNNENVTKSPSVVPVSIGMDKTNSQWFKNITKNRPKLEMSTIRIIKKNPIESLSYPIYYRIKHPNTDPIHSPTAATTTNLLNLESQNEKRFIILKPNENLIANTTAAAKRRILKKRIKPPKISTSTSSNNMKNLQKPTVSTATEPTVNPSNHRPYIIDTIEESENVIGLVPPEEDRRLYKTIVDVAYVDNVKEASENIDDEDDTDSNSISSQSPAPVTEVINEIPENSLNKYIFVGLKPPLSKRAHPYFEYISTNKIGRRTISNNNNKIPRGKLRIRRNASRLNYSQVSRNRGRQNEGLETSTTSSSRTTGDAADDYVPHRPRNFHYDEKTKRIIYHDKPKESNVEEEEVEEEEIEEIKETPGRYLERVDDATHPTPQKSTTSPLLATATPPPDGKGLLDFVVKLKNNPNYKLIPDPTTQKPGATTTTTTKSLTGSTKPPEFLNILSKVRSDQRYKLIEDPEESRIKTSTVAYYKESGEEGEENDDDEEEEEQLEGHAQGIVESVALSPALSLSKVEIFDIGDYIPKIETPISSVIETNPIKKFVIDRFFPQLGYMSLLDVVKDYLSQTAPVQYIKSKLQDPSQKKPTSLPNFQIFDIGDYIPNVTTINPKTFIDYSKYKTIERPKPNSSTRYHVNENHSSEEKKEGAERTNTDYRNPVIKNEESRNTNTKVDTNQHRQREPEKKEEVIHTSTQTSSKSPETRLPNQRIRPHPIEADESRVENEASTTSVPIFQNRRRQRPSETLAEVAETPEIDDNPSFPKPKRVYRRRPIRIKPNNNSNNNNKDENNNEDPQLADKLVRRSTAYEDDDVGDEILEKDANRPKDEVVVTKGNYDKVKKHGGNYKGQSDDNVDNADYEDDETTTKKQKPNDKNKELTKDDDKIKKERESLSKSASRSKNIILNQQTGDRSAKVTSPTEQNNQKTNNNKDVEIINKFNMKNKHGGNYKDEQDAIIDELLEDNKEVNVEAVQNRPAEVATVNKRNNRRINENNENDKVTSESEKVWINSQPKSKNVNKKQQDNDDKLDKGWTNFDYSPFNTEEFEKNFKNNNETSGAKNTNNDRRRGNVKFTLDEDEIYHDDKQQQQQTPTKQLLLNRQTVGLNKFNTTKLKTVHFYTDTKLPREINQLHEKSVPPSNIDVDDFKQIIEEGDIIDSVEKSGNNKTGDRGNRGGSRIEHYANNNNNNKNDNSNSNSNRSVNRKISNTRHKNNDNYNQSNNNRNKKYDSNNKSSNAKNPLIEKDPSKRLYYFAPV